MVVESPDVVYLLPEINARSPEPSVGAGPGLTQIRRRAALDTPVLICTIIVSSSFRYYGIVIIWPGLVVHCILDSGLRREPPAEPVRLLNHEGRVRIAP